MHRLRGRVNAQRSTIALLARALLPEEARSLVHDELTGRSERARAAARLGVHQDDAALLAQAEEYERLAQLVFDPHAAAHRRQAA